MSLRRLKSTWENLGRVDPLWAVLSYPGRRHGHWDIAEFMATGGEQISWVNGLLQDEELSLGDRVLDFGCGVGRLTNALAEHVAEVVGVDIAGSMVEQATKLNQYPGRVSFRGYDGRNLPFDDGSFDSAISLIVLQHARPPVQLACLLELQRVVRVGGVLVLQIPSHPKLSPPLEPEALRASIEIIDAPGVLVASQAATVHVRVKNLSQLNWPVGRMVKLGNHWFDGETQLVQNDGRTDLPCDVGPGEAVELDLLVTAPPVRGRVQLELDMLQELVTWWKDAGSQPARVEVAITELRSGEVDANGDRVADVTADPAGETVEEPQSVSAAVDDDLGSAMEMHGLHTTLVRSLFTHCGWRVVSATPDAMAGPEWESFTYVLRRAS